MRNTTTGRAFRTSRCISTAGRRGARSRDPGSLVCSTSPSARPNWRRSTCSPLPSSARQSTCSSTAATGTRSSEPPQWARTLQTFHSIVSAAFIVFAVVLCLYLVAENTNPFGAVLLPFLIAIGAYLAVRFAALSYLALYMGRYDARMIMSTHVLLAPLCVSLVMVVLARLWHDRLGGPIYSHSGQMGIFPVSAFAGTIPKDEIPLSG